MRLIILNGFDRSGTSLVGGLLSKHPQINYFFQPFSSTEIHKSQYQPWASSEHHPATQSFLQAMQEGRIKRDYIASDWFERFSDYDLENTQSVGIIKETKLHTKIEWLKNTFPDIEVYGIWRNPRAVLCSLIRNGFHEKWYGDEAFEATCTLVREDERLEALLPFLDERLSGEARMALIFAARTQLLMLSLCPDKWLVYEQVLSNPDNILNRFCRGLGLDEFRFSEWCGKDYNVVGLPYQRQDLWKTYFNGTVPVQVEQIIGSMNNVPDAA
ncbi:hypothetical protein MNBD_GAMMA15-2041 [hydrothermal vent metagenome]|uniref:Sulfotransferase domain-containing protein n=1 Tax=hydrothermal vent metagenome TaxID=652676 RepID=A0A3B0YL74_9ZZZZ